jgi:hypothetical protein
MNSRSHHIAAVGILLALPGIVNAQKTLREEYPKLCAALEELRHAKAAIQGGRDAWPAEQHKQAVEAMNDAMKSLATIMGIRDINSFRGVERKPEYYKRFKEHAHLRAALQDLREARRDLHEATSDFRGLKERALDDIDIACGELVKLIRYKKR